MQFFDKSRNTEVKLDEDPSEKLVFLKESDAEQVAIPSAILTSGGTVRSVTPRVLRVSMPRDAESLDMARKGLEELAEDEGVDFVAIRARSENGEDMFVVPGRISVLIRGLTKAKAKEAIEGLGYRLEESGRSRGLYLVTIPTGADIAEAIAKINAIPEVVLAEPLFVGIDDQELRVGVRIGQALGDDSENLDDHDPGAGCPYAWNHDRIRAASAWGTTRGSDKVVIAVVDGLPELEHDALKGRIITDLHADMSFAEGGGTSSHATNVASLALGQSDCFSGIAPDCRLLPLIVDLGVQEYWRRADAIFYAAERARAGKVKGVAFKRMVMVCSWKMASDISIVRLALSEVVEAGVLVVTSAGNRDTDAAHWPSDYGAEEGVLGTGVLSIGATDAQDARAFYSNWSDKVDLSAPGGDGPPFDGGDLRCAGLFNSYDHQAGTSLAAPHVAAAGALALSVDPTLTVAALKRALRDTADPIATDRPIGTGRLNLARLLEAVNPPAPPPPDGEVGADRDNEAPDVNEHDTPPDQQGSDAENQGPSLFISVRDHPPDGDTETLAPLVDAFRDQTREESDSILASILFRSARGETLFEFDT